MGKPLSAPEMACRMSELFGDSVAMASGPVVLESVVFADVSHASM